MQYMLLIYDNENAWAVAQRNGRRRHDGRVLAVHAGHRQERPLQGGRAAPADRRRPRRFAFATASVRRPTARSPKRANTSAATTSSTRRISTRPSASRSEFRRRARARSKCVPLSRGRCRRERRARPETGHCPARFARSPDASSRRSFASSAISISPRRRCRTRSPSPWSSGRARMRFQTIRARG